MSKIEPISAIEAELKMLGKIWKDKENLKYAEVGRLYEIVRHLKKLNEKMAEATKEPYVD